MWCYWGSGYIIIVINHWKNTASKKWWAQCGAKTLHWPCFWCAGQFTKEAGSKVGHLFDYWQWNNSGVLRRHTVFDNKDRGDAANTLEPGLQGYGTLETGHLTSLGSQWCRNLYAQESPQGLLIDEKRKAAWANLYQLIRSELSSGLMFLRNYFAFQTQCFMPYSTS